MEQRSWAGKKYGSKETFHAGAIPKRTNQESEI
jgi:hypothetical protein